MLKDNNCNDFSCFAADNTEFLEEMYNRYLHGDKLIGKEWEQAFSKNLTSINNSYTNDSYTNQKVDVTRVSFGQNGTEIVELLHFFRSYGHLEANLDPLDMSGKKVLDCLQCCNINNIKKETNFNGLLGLRGATIEDFISILKSIYCGKMGFEFMHIISYEEREWLQNKIENDDRSIKSEEKKEILGHLIESETFEQFLQVKYPGYKRFSIEGGESCVVALEKIISNSFNYDISDIIIGMAHRGRLNVLTKVMGKSYTAILSEFMGNLVHSEDLGVSGDVKYHLGYSCDRNLGESKKNVHMSLCPNPSHLEAVNPVVLGKVRYMQDNVQNNDRMKILGVLIHGDASFAGQGIISEILTLSNLSGYSTGGTVHIIINNQIGFTTTPKDARSSLYCSDVAKFIGAPIFHVNGDDPEAVVFVTNLAMEYRQEFKKDVVIDLVCYRRYGHNEGDEPMFTQPVMYDVISKHKTTMKLYEERLISESVMDVAEVEALHHKFRDHLEKCLADSKSYKPGEADWFQGVWSKLYRPTPGNLNDYITETGVSAEKLVNLAKSLSMVPKGFHLNKKVDKLLQNRLEVVTSGENIDWATGEALAFASLLSENHSIRLSGQDCGRGTFSQRHACLTDQTTGEKYIPLNNLGCEQAKFEVLDSPLSEYGVMGFEYGYSIASPYSLVLWEGQFGDFANGAQIIIDQFIVSAESKWLRSSGLVLLLPHGYEGQGPEHSSARIERYLQLCAEDNIQVLNCSTPANYFHALRRQLHRDFRKPLVIFTPKSLLRHKMAVSNISDFSSGFIPLIPEVGDLCQDDKVRKVIICSGKIYYDIIEYRLSKGINEIAVLRLEQFYPFPVENLREQLLKYTNAQVVWCQEEPMNMGAWSFVSFYIEDILAKINNSTKCFCIARKSSASTSTGYVAVHAKEQQEILTALMV